MTTIVSLHTVYLVVALMAALGLPGSIWGLLPSKRGPLDVAPVWETLVKAFSAGLFLASILFAFLVTLLWRIE